MSGLGQRETGWSRLIRIAWAAGVAQARARGMGQVNFSGTRGRTCVARASTQRIKVGCLMTVETSPKGWKHSYV